MPKQLNCSTCGAPLGLTEISQPTAICSYCGTTLLLPEEILGDSGQFGFRPTAGSGGSILSQAGKIAEIAHLTRTGKKIDAIKLYRETFGVGLKEAKDAIDNLEAGRPVSIISVSGMGVGGKAAADALQAVSAVKKTLWPMLLIIVAVVVVTAVIGVLGAAGGIAAFLSGLKTETKSATTTSSASTERAKPAAKETRPPKARGFAEPILEFGTEGIGAGQFVDARSVALGGEGRIYVGEYQGGRVQVFDSQGAFLTQWMVDRDRALLNLVADRRGDVYVVHPGSILRYEGATGQLAGQVSLPTGGVKWSTCTDAAVALDGTMVVVDSHSNIAWIGSDGRLKNLVSGNDKVGERISIRKIAVDGEGNLFGLDGVQDCVFKFGPDGRYINRFGGKPDRFSGRRESPGELSSPSGIAVDGKGRVYVSDSGIVVFDPSGRYLSTIGDGVVFGVAINDRNEVFATHRNEHKIRKYALTE